MLVYPRVKHVENVHEYYRFEVGLVFILEHHLAETPELSVVPYITPTFNFQSGPLCTRFFLLNLPHNHMRIEGSQPEQHIHQKVNSTQILTVHFLVFLDISAFDKFQIMKTTKIRFPLVNIFKHLQQFSKHNTPYFLAIGHQSEHVNRHHIAVNWIFLALICSGFGWYSFKPTFHIRIIDKFMYNCMEQFEPKCCHLFLVLPVNCVDQRFQLGQNLSWGRTWSAYVLYFWWDWHLLFQVFYVFYVSLEVLLWR